MDEKKKKTDEQNADTEKQKEAAKVLSAQALKQRARRKVLVTAVILLLCSILMLYLMVDKPSEAELRILDYAREHKISALRYPEELVTLLENNPQAENFVLHYPDWEDNPVKPEIHFDAADLIDGVPIFKQWDERWGYLHYGDTRVCIDGSGPLCLAMAGYYLTADSRFHPDQVVEFALENDFYVPGTGTKPNLIYIGGEALDLEVTDFAKVEDKIAHYLQNGCPFIAQVSGGSFDEANFHGGNHFIVLKQYRNDKIEVIDPSSFSNTREWSFGDLKGHIDKLWLIQLPEEG